jgi:hypothetical protein
MKCYLLLLVLLPFLSYSQGIPVDKKNAQNIISTMEQKPVIVYSVKVKRMWKVYKMDRVMKSKFNHDVVQVKYTVGGKRKIKVFDLSLIEMDQESYEIVTSK